MHLLHMIFYNDSIYTQASKSIISNKVYRLCMYTYMPRIRYPHFIANSTSFNHEREAKSTVTDLKKQKFFGSYA